MDLSTMADWLDWMATVHSKEWDLGLDRIKPVAIKMGVEKFDCPVVIVGGTNGKGSTVAVLESIYRQAGYNVGAFTSPVIYRHNEQVRLNGESPNDQTFCDAFNNVQAARGEITLTPFEFQTLAALDIFKSNPLDVLLLEVGLGGRLDATNIIDADVAIVTSIGIDHVEYLGDTREKIGFEKAGIFRQGHPAVCGDPEPPASLVEYAEKLGAILYMTGSPWNYMPREDNLFHLAPRNIANAVKAVELLQARLPVSVTQIQLGIQHAKLPGRLEVFPGDVTEIRDVSHNIDSVGWLSQKLSSMPCSGKTYAVFSMLADKDIQGCVALIKHQIDEWFVAPLAVKRGASLARLKEVFQQEAIDGVNYFDSIKLAYDSAKQQSIKNDRIVVFGSFHTLGECPPHT